MSIASEAVVMDLDGYMTAQRKWHESMKYPPDAPTDRLARDVTDARLKLVQSLDRLARGKDDPAP